MSGVASMIYADTMQVPTTGEHPHLMTLIAQAATAYHIAGMYQYVSASIGMYHLRGRHRSAEVDISRHKSV